MSIPIKAYYESSAGIDEAVMTDDVDVPIPMIYDRQSEATADFL